MIKNEKNVQVCFLDLWIKKMPPEILAVGFEGLSVLKNNHKTYLTWNYSDEEFHLVRMIIIDRISFILKVLAKYGKIDNKDRIIMVNISRFFDKVSILIDSVSSYDKFETLLAISQAFHSPYGWKEGNVDFNSVYITDKKMFLVTRVISLIYFNNITNNPAATLSYCSVES